MAISTRELTQVRVHPLGSLDSLCVSLSVDDITEDMRRFPHYKFLVTALFDTLANLLGTFPTPHIGYAILHQRPAVEDGPMSY